MHATGKNIDAFRFFSAFFLLLFCSCLSRAQRQAATTGDGWNSYGGDPGGSRYSSALQITRENVAQLKVAWTFHTGASQLETKLIRKAAFEL